MILIYKIVFSIVFTIMFFENFNIENKEKLQVVIFVFSFLLVHISYSLLMKEDKNINNKIFSLKAFNMGSFGNYFGQTDGHRWTLSKYLKNKMKSGDLYINNFKFDSSVFMKFRFYSLRKYFENFKCYINSNDLIKGIVVIGQMGSGKTVFFNNIINQNRFNRYLINDTKGDFTSIFYSHKRDIIINPYDDRGQIWNPFEEAQTSPFVIEIFLDNLLSSIAGDRKDFFSGSSKDRYMMIFNDIHHKKPNIHPKDKFNLFIEQLNEYFEAANSGAQDSEKDIVSTMKLTLEFFKYMNFCIQNGAKTFTIYRFLHQKNIKMFLLSRDDQASKLNPFYAGFLAAFSAVLLSLPDRKKDTTGLILDEYITLANNLSESVLEGLHTRLRSKNGVLMTGIQYAKKKNSNLEQALLNSCTYWFIFQGIDSHTLQIINTTVGQSIYKKVNSNIKNIKQQVGHNNLNASFSYQTDKADIITNENIQTLGKNFNHITFIPKEKILYKAYTPEIKLEKRADEFVQSDNISKYYRSL